MLVRVYCETVTFGGVEFLMNIPQEDPRHKFSFGSALTSKYSGISWYHKIVLLERSDWCIFLLRSSTLQERLCQKFFPLSHVLEEFLQWSLSISWTDRSPLYVPLICGSLTLSIVRTTSNRLYYLTFCGSSESWITRVLCQWTRSFSLNCKNERALPMKISYRVIDYPSRALHLNSVEPRPKSNDYLKLPPLDNQLFTPSKRKKQAGTGSSPLSLVKENGYIPQGTFRSTKESSVHTTFASQRSPECLGLNVSTQPTTLSFASCHR